MPIFTAAVAAVATTFAISTATATFLVSTSLSLGLSYAARALSGANNKPSAATDHFSVQGKLQAGGDVPRSFNLGYSATAGSFVYANVWGDAGGTPNSFLTQVIALQDVPSKGLAEVRVDGELCTLDMSAAPDLRGKPVLEYRKDGNDYLWVNFYDGTQTVADPLLVNFVSSADRPYGASRVGHGISYVTCTSCVEDTLFNNIPSFKFATYGTKLYDISKDSTAGGVGSHRWSDRSTWGGDGDDLPAVQIYNLLRGVTYNDQWLYGLQAMTAARLPAVNWVAQINKCRATITGEGGSEPTYRSGGQINVNAQIANAVEALLTACQGRVSEIGGFYKIHLGAPDSPEAGFDFTDDDILSTEAQSFAPFFPLSDSINGITASFPFPAEGWNTKVAPPLYRTDLETRDGNRRLLANPQFDFVPYAAQVQRLMKSALEEAQRARRHTVVMPPAFWPLEPGDVVSWSSVRNGYEEKQFRVDGVVDKANLDVILNLTEVDPSDYDWDHGTEFQPVYAGPTVISRPAPQGVLAWDAQPYTLKDADGFSRRPAIRLSWDGTLPGIRGVTYQVRLASDHSAVTSNNTDQITSGAVIISAGILPQTAYQARGQYIPSAPRDMLWSNWIDVTTPDVRLSATDLDDAVIAMVSAVAAYDDEPLRAVVDTIAAFVAAHDARYFMGQNGLRDQTNSIRERLETQVGAANASIETVKTTAAGTAGALATLDATTNTRFATTNSNVASNATAISLLSGSFTSFSTAATAHFLSLDSSVAANGSAITTLSGSLSNYVTSVSAAATYATLSGLSTTNSTVSTHSTSIATLTGYAAAAHSLILDVNGYIVGYEFVNGGAGASSFTVTTGKFQIAAPGVTGGAAVPIFTVANVNGSPKVALRGDMYVDGDILARHIAVTTLSAIKADLGTVTAGRMLSPSGKVDFDLNNQRFVISD